MYTKIGVELFARGIRYTIGFAMTYTEELARGYTYTARACEGVYGIQRLTVYPYHPLVNGSSTLKGRWQWCLQAWGSLKCHSAMKQHYLGRHSPAEVCSLMYRHCIMMYVQWHSSDCCRG